MYLNSTCQHKHRIKMHIKGIRKMTIYERIKELARVKKISIRELEKQLGFSNGTVRNWTNSTNSQSLEKVANFFNVSTDYLLGRTNIKDKVSDRIRKLEKYVPVKENEDNHAYYNERAILINTFDTLVNLLILNGFELGYVSDDLNDNYNFYSKIISSYSGGSKEKISLAFLELIAEIIVTIDDNKSDVDKILKDVNDFKNLIRSKYNKYDFDNSSDIPF